MSIGERLRIAREERGLSLDDIARTTFIRVHHLEAIEKEDYSSIPPSRLHYFVRDFARNVGLNPDDLIAELPETPVAQAPPATPPPVISKRRSTRKDKEELQEQDAEIAGASAQVTTEQRRRKPRYKPIDQGNPLVARALITVAVVLLIGLGIYYISGGFDRSEKPSSTPIAGDTASPTRVLSRPDGLEDSEGEEVFDGDSLVLQGRFIDKVWYSITIDGQREEQSTVDSGEVRTWKAAEKFSVSLGNAGGVELMLNGKSIGTLASLGKSVRGKIITAEGVKGGE